MTASFSANPSNPHKCMTCGFNILRDGEKTVEYSLFFSCTRSDKIIADSMEPVIPHFPNPVATNRSGVFLLYGPMYGLLSRDMQSCVAQK